MYDKLIKTLKDLNIDFEEYNHELTTSCEHSLIIREKLGLTGSGSKNIVYHAKGIFYLVTTLGHKNFKARLFKKEFLTKDIRFATSLEIGENNLGIIGSIPPFGFENSNITLYVDKEIFKNEYFMFNPFNGEKTIRLKSLDLKKVYESLENNVKYFEIIDDEIKFFE
ncbi:MAG: hypothetical protein NWP80_01725 [Candidatus Gracilibacteria bacterium]|nr:hypothetical protein [Candidatus Gracilibacteria bacterium]